MHTYDLLKQKNARNMLKALTGFPAQERDLIFEALGKLKESESSYLPFFHQLTDALIARGYEIQSTGDIGVILIVTLMSPQMRNYYKWAKQTVTEMTKFDTIFDTEEQAKERGQKVGRLLVRRFYRTLGDIYGVEFMLSNDEFATEAERATELQMWAVGFVPRVIEALGFEPPNNPFTS